MNKVILASHGDLSSGMLDTARMIVGDLPNVYAVSTQRDERIPITDATRNLLRSFSKEDKVYILTDVLSGSVNNAMLSLVNEYPDLTIICGMNACLVLELVTMDADISDAELSGIIEESRGQITDCTKKLQDVLNQDEEDEL